MGKKSLFKDKEEFLRYCLNDDEDFATEFDEDEKPNFTVDDVKEGYIRYYPHFSEDMGMDIDSGWTFCNKGKGAIEVYFLDLQ